MASISPLPPTPPCPRRLPSSAAGVACTRMPARKPLPDLGDVDPIELQLEVLGVLEELRLRHVMGKVQFGVLLKHAGGARLVLAQALARIR
jgi:hypothetical protein